jgi:carboxyl-terminal processing protease
VTVAKYLTPDGTDINQQGISPDVAVELTDEQRQELFGVNNEIGTGDDLQYTRALQELDQLIAGEQPGKQAAQ